MMLTDRVGLQDHALLPQASALTADVLVAPPGPSATRLAPFSAAGAQRAVAGAAGYRWVDSSLGALSVAASYVGRTGVCGNGFCEARPALRSPPCACASSAGMQGLLCGQHAS